MECTSSQNWFWPEWPFSWIRAAKFSQQVQKKRLKLNSPGAFSTRNGIFCLLRRPPATQAKFSCSGQPKCKILESCGRKNVYMCAPWTFLFILARTSSFWPAKTNKWIVTLVIKLAVRPEQFNFRPPFKPAMLNWTRLFKYRK